MPNGPAPDIADFLEELERQLPEGADIEIEVCRKTGAHNIKYKTRNGEPYEIQLTPQVDGQYHIGHFQNKESANVHDQMANNATHASQLIHTIILQRFAGNTAIIQALNDAWDKTAPTESSLSSEPVKKHDAAPAPVKRL